MNLPTPDPAFRWSQEAWGHALRCRPLERIAQHLFTTRQLRLRPLESQTASWEAALHAAGGSLDELRRVRQVHGRAVRIVRPDDAAQSAAPPEGDALVTNTPGRVLAVQIADCVPLLMADPETGAVAAVHAGWRGSAARIAPAAVQALVSEFGARAGDLIVAVGPSIGACCYEVGAELVSAFRDAGASDDQIRRWFTRAADGSLRLDLWAVNYEQLVEAGVPADQIYVSRLCTKTNRDVFDSYRAEGPEAGRMAALIRCERPGAGSSYRASTANID